MKTLSWNVRGLGGSRTQQRLRHMLRDINPSVIFLVETKLQSSRMEKFRKSRGFVNGIDVSSNGRSGGLSLAWKRDCKVSLRSFSDSHIDVLFDEDNDGVSWRCTGFYGAPQEQNRRQSWNLLRLLNDSPSIPWLVIGDFNELLFSHEKRGGRLRSARQMDDFREALNECSLEDIGFQGQWFTWEWGRLQSNNIRERLDRGVANQLWCDLFPHYTLEHLGHSFLDHCPLLLSSNMGQNIGGRAFHFRFEASWLLEDTCEAEVTRLWNSASVSVPDRLHTVSVGLDSWFRRIKKAKNIKMKDLKKRLNELNELQPSDSVLGDILDTKIALNLEMDREELYWEQRARANWLKHGDRNTRFFHRFATSRHRRNRINKLIGDGGIQVDTEKEISELATSYFESLFTSQATIDPAMVLEGISPCITPEMNKALLADFTSEEILIALQAMSPLKASGEDGVQPISRINSTYVVLIPKITNPTTMTHFRPISLCNVLVKMVTKVLANRLQSFIHLCIDEAQSAFLPGRLISDNVIAAYEILHSYKQKRSGRKGSFALKLDMAKAYDRVEWSFLVAVMKKLGFAQQWTDLLMSCISTVSYSIVINGKVGDAFVPTRGLRQGDPISPYLFLLCSEGLSSLLRTASISGSLQGARIARGAPLVTHLLFADDSIIFGEASSSAATNLKNILHTYSQCSGQLINFEKSSLFFSSNVSNMRKGEVCSILNAPVLDNLDKYLGLPSMIGRNKRAALAGLKDRFKGSTDHWNTRLLSLGGKEVYIKSVLQAIPLYTMACFLLPSSLCKELEAVMAKYWWGQSPSKSGIHWCTWQALCLPKFEGGMGFRDLGKFNLALLAKQGWRLLSNPSSLVARLLRAKRVLESDIYWKVDRGHGLSIWDEWRSDFIAANFNQQDYDNITAIKLSTNGGADVLTCNQEKDGHYSVRSGYRVLLNESVDPSLHKFYDRLWRISCPAKIKILLWKFSRNFVPTRHNLSIKRVTTNVLCPRCQLFREDINHVSHLCSFAKAIWSDFNFRWPSNIDQLDFCQYQNIHSITTFVRSYLIELGALSTSLSHPHTREQVHWSPPQFPFVKLNFDASYSSASKKSWSGCVIRDSEAQILGSAFKTNTDVLSAFEAEALSALQGIKFAKDLGFSNLIVEGDSRSIIKKLASPSVDLSVISHLICDAQNAARSFNTCRFTFIGRNGNIAAHAMADYGRREDTHEGFWVEDAPATVLQVSDEDRRSLAHR
ncbi:hypothetical protein HRI_001841900 [Hibiscus trionum]|uniref:Reverse transcriptase domain-containing protein n=1 Tax=Hibiscus trionum TaxID=183268 RepID=A0A9W7LZ82_HIBTR|nr:hypothetical protein HRI_001841900 [Hibiscus trionum]